MGNNASVVQSGRTDRPRSDFFTETFASKLPVDPGAYYVEQDKKKLGGVGIVFANDENSQLIVFRLVKHGPAHLTGRVNKGDRLTSIDGKVLLQNPGQKPNVSGWEGTTVKLGFTTPDDEPYVVQLERNSRCYPDEMALVAPGFNSLVDTRTGNRNSGPPPISPRGSLPAPSLGYAGGQQVSPRAPVKTWTPGPTMANPWTADRQGGGDGGAPMASELFEWRYSQGGGASGREMPTTPSGQQAAPRVGGAALVEEVPLEKLPQARRDIMPPAFFASVKDGVIPSPASPRILQSRPVSMQSPPGPPPSQNLLAARPVSEGGPPGTAQPLSIRQMSAQILDNHRPPSPRQNPPHIIEQGFI